MERVGDMLRRAKQNRQRRSALAAVQKQAETTRLQHQSSHAQYSALMRSHDRVRTRHVAGKGGTGGA